MGFTAENFAKFKNWWWYFFRVPCLFNQIYQKFRNFKILNGTLLYEFYISFENLSITHELFVSYFFCDENCVDVYKNYTWTIFNLWLKWPCRPQTNGVNLRESHRAERLNCTDTTLRVGKRGVMQAGKCFHQNYKSKKLWRNVSTFREKESEGTGNLSHGSR